MQGNWQNMVQQQEVMPPEGVWDSIALALDEADRQPNWQKTIYHASATPPSDSWQHIAQALDADAGGSHVWQERVYQYEVAPPGETWQMVAEMLDKQAVNPDWNAQLYNQKATPPQAAWEYIVTQLNDAQTPVVPISQRPVRKLGVWRIAVAAVTVLAVAGTTLWLMRDRFTTNDPAVAINTGGTEALPKAPTNIADTPASIAVAEPATVAPIATTTTVAKTTVNKTSGSKKPAATIATLEYVTHNEMTFLPADFVLNNTRKLPNENGQTVVDINGMDAPNSNYINISGPDGQSIRVSAKFASLLGYLNEGTGQEERLDRIIKESAFWKATFKQWREKMTDADAAPSPNNFMGLIEMVKVLQ